MMWQAFLLMVSSSSLHCPPFDKPPQPQQKKEKKKGTSAVIKSTNKAGKGREKILGILDS